MEATGTGELGVIAGKGAYPLELMRNARRHGVGRIALAAFEGETDPEAVHLADVTEWMRVGQLGRLIRFFARSGVRDVMMAGQITPGNLFSLRPDMKALLLLGRLRERNAESLFGAVADELGRSGIRLLPATTHMEGQLAPEGVIAGPDPGRRILEAMRFGLSIAKEISRLDIGQTVVVRGGTVLAVEGFDGTDATLRRGGELGGGKAVAVKVSKPRQDFRFDVPVLGRATLEVAAASGIRHLCVEAGATLILEWESVKELAESHAIGVYGARHET